MVCERNCKNCGKLLERRRKGKTMESMRDFRRREFCDKRCSSKFQHADKTQVAVQIKEAVESVELGEDQEKKTAMEFLEGIINDSKVDHVTRVNAAKALLPYQEKRTDKTGKKQEKADAAQQAGKGRFGAMSGPKVVNLKQG